MLYHYHVDLQSFRTYYNFECSMWYVRTSCSTIAEHNVISPRLYNSSRCLAYYSTPYHWLYKKSCKINVLTYSTGKRLSDFPPTFPCAHRHDLPYHVYSTHWTHILFNDILFLALNRCQVRWSLFGHTYIYCFRKLLTMHRIKVVQYLKIILYVRWNGRFDLTFTK